MTSGVPVELRFDHAAWMADAACRGNGPAVFFPRRGGPRGASNQVARVVCGACPVKAPCLEYALDNGIGHGTWGGKSVRERRAIAQQRRTDP